MARSWGDKCHELSRRNSDQLRTNRNPWTGTERQQFAWAEGVFSCKSFQDDCCQRSVSIFSFSLILWHKTYQVDRKLNCKLFDPMRSRVIVLVPQKWRVRLAFLLASEINCFSHLCVRPKALTIRYFFRDSLFFLFHVKIISLFLQRLTIIFLIFNNYSLKWRWIVVDIYRAAPAARKISTTIHRHWGE